MPPKMNNQAKSLARVMQRSFVRLVSVVLLVVLLAAVIWLPFNLTTIRDEFILLNYQPPAAVAALARQDGLTNYAKTLFYVNRPAILNKTDFAKQCPNRLEQSYVIGCYHSGDNGIYLLDVTDPRLNGIVAVTAAYEMLHAGYARLSGSERTYLDSLMWNYYQTSVSSPEIHQQMSAYAKTEPGAKYDELYSVLATEVASLPPQLETHYRLYFQNRQAIVKTYDGYEAEFTRRQQAIATYDSELSTLNGQIQSQEAKLNSLQSSINAQSASLQNLLNAGNYATYNSQIPGYNAQVNTYNNLLAQTKAQISEYNNLVGERNSLVLEEQQLVQAINSSSLPNLPTK